MMPHSPLSGKELIYSVFNHKEVDTIPWVPFAGVHAGSLCNYTASEVLLDSEKLLEALLKVNEIYHPDGQPILFDLQVEAEILGCTLQWADKSPPTVISHPLASDITIPTKIPSRDDGRLPIILEAMQMYKALVGEKTALFGLLCGPLTLASHLRGMAFYLDLITNPQYCHQLIEYCTEVAHQIADYYIEAGMDVIAIVDPVVSQVSPKTFQEFLLQPFKSFFAYIRQKKVFSSFFVCGDATKNLEIMTHTYPDSIFVDENINMKTAQDIFQPKGILLGGNIPLTTIMLFGTQQDNMQYVIDLIDNVGSNNLIIATGCDMPYDTPPENVIGVIQATKEPTLIKESLLNYQSTEPNIDIILPDYSNLLKPLIEVFTIDSDVCAACGYMLNAAKEIKAYFKDKIDLIEYKYTNKENIVRGKKLHLKHLPVILINGKVIYSSLIPSKPEFVQEIEKVL